MRRSAWLVFTIVVFALGCDSDPTTNTLPATGVATSPGQPSAGSSVPPTAGVSAGAAGTPAAQGGAGASTATGRAGSSGAPSPAGAAGSASAAGASAGSGSGEAGTSAAGASAGSGSGEAGASAGSGVSQAGVGGSAVAGSGGAAGSVEPAAGSGGAAGSDGSTTGFKSPCIADGQEVVFIGDSYSDYAIAHASLASFMEGLASEDGALMQGDTYRNLAVAGTTLATPPAAIQSQWTDAMSSTPIKVVVMTGGGNDVLIDNTQCRPEGSEERDDCKMVVANSLAAAEKLFASMKETGVTDVLYFWYPHIPGGALTGYESGASLSDYTYPMLQSLAESASTDTFHVYTVPTVQIFEGHPEYFYSDGLHANDEGEAKIAEAIWQVMKDNCIGQAASSGCCAP